jgi:hypothetical protein
MNDAHDRFAPLTDGERSAHQMKECQKPDDGALVVPVPPDAPAAPASHKRAADRLTAGTPPTRSLSGATWAPSGRLRVRKVGRRTIVTPTMPTSG